MPDVEPIEAVIFDCDGTLVDSEPLAHQALVECLAPLGIHLSLTEALRRYVGGRMADCAADIERRTGRRLPDSFVPAVRARTSELFRSDLQPMAGAATTLQALQALHVPLCVASSGPPDKIALSLGVTGLARYFAPEHVFSAYAVGHWKPDPALFLHAAAALGVAPKRCTVVEDSPPGIQAGVAAGMHTFWLHGRAPLPAAVTALPRLTDLPDLLAPGIAAAMRGGGAHQRRRGALRQGASD
ncbi:MAG TPA: HAD-IA family hydrolase [Rhodanobacteraceae bacterium]